MAEQGPTYTVSLAQSDADLRAAQALRYAVFVRELGGGGAMVDHAAGLERDAFDAFSDHLLLRDGSGAVVGVYRLMQAHHAEAAGRFYSAAEYDLAPLLASGRRLLELGRSCLHPDHRGGTAMYHLWTALGDYVAEAGIDILFGVASFHGTDVAALAQPLALLHARHLAPPELRPRAVDGHFQRMDLVPEAEIDRRAAMVGEGAFVDHAFNTTDICLVLDTARMNARSRRIYGQAGP